MFWLVRFGRGILAFNPAQASGQLSFVVIAFEGIQSRIQMGYWLCAENDIEDLTVNSWRWGATVPLIQESNILEPDVEIFGDRMVFAKMDSCLKLADWFENNFLKDLDEGSRIGLDGKTTSEPDDGTFHRDDLAKNYSADRDWLLQFVQFLRECGGFNTLG